MRYVKVDKNALPSRQKITFEGAVCELRFVYNASFDFFTADLYISGAPVTLGEKIVYGKPLFTTSATPLKTTVILPLDVSRQESRVTFENLGETVFLYVFDIESKK